MVYKAILTAAQRYAISKLVALGWSYASAKTKVLRGRYNSYRSPMVKRNRFSVSRRNFPTEVVHTFSRKIHYPSGSGGTINVQSFASTAALNTFGYEFSMNDLDIMGGAGSYTSALTSMYDQYRILKCTVTFVPRFTEAGISNTGVEIPKLYTVIDYDSNSLSLTEDQILQFQNVKVTRGNKVHSRTLVPCIRMDSEASVGAVTLKRKQWVDMADLSITHFGIYALTPKLVNQDGTTPGSPQSFIWDTYLNIVFQCKGLR